MNIFSNIKKQYSATGGYLEFLKIAFPLVVSTGVDAIQLFINRIFLSRYSQDAFAAASPAGMAQWAIMSFFIGALAYIDIFVAQYYGKKEYRSIGPAIWQSLYLSFISAIIILFLSFFSKRFFVNLGHPYTVALEEVEFFKILCYGAFPTIAVAALSGFYTGQGKTKVVLFIWIYGVIVNIILDYCMIFGNFGFPEMGIRGAALANNIASITMFVIYMFMISSKKNSIVYNTRKFMPDFDFIKTFLGYTIPNGTQFFFDMASFSIFVLIIGRIGIEELTASNIVTNINSLVIAPLIGCSLTTSIMVGNYLGKNKASIAQVSVRSASHILYTYALFVILVLIFLPNQLIYPFSGGVQTVIIERTRPMAVNILRILAVYLIFDIVNMIFSSAIKGAGDTVFVMKILASFSIFLIIIPVYFIVIVFKLSIYVAWWSMLIYVISLAFIFYLRYRSNKWKKLRVIDMDIVDG
ncbi:MAG: MATE family efflux transporter [Endomicrobium sp.]|jgi:MATE family multidrug resistance protein|nr:MATE family efflux transporter [Endomicrobium sp.]